MMPLSEPGDSGTAVAAHRRLLITSLFYSKCCTEIPPQRCSQCPCADRPQHPPQAAAGREAKISYPRSLPVHHGSPKVPHTQVVVASKLKVLLSGPAPLSGLSTAWQPPTAAGSTCGEARLEHQAVTPPWGQTGQHGLMSTTEVCRLMSNRAVRATSTTHRSSPWSPPPTPVALSPSKRDGGYGQC